MENAALSALTKDKPQAQWISRLDPQDLLDLMVTRALKVLLVPMACPDSLDFPDLLAPLAPLALAEDTCPRSLMAVRSPAAHLSQDPLAQWVPVDLLEFQVLLAPKDSLVPQASPVSLVQLVPWVLVAPMVLLERTEMMVRLVKLVVLVSVEALVLRELVDSPEPLDCPASRDTEVSLV